MTQSMPFSGKWTLESSTNLYLSLKDTNTGTLTLIESASLGSSEHFNLYGQFDTSIWIQSSNWKYLAFQDNSYLSNQNRDSEKSVTFIFEKVADDQYRILEKGSDSNEYYVDVQGTSLVRILKTPTPPTTTIFNLGNITPSLADIQQQQGLPVGNLTGAFLSGADLSNLMFQNGDFSFANLSGSITKLSGCDFSQCTVDDTDFSECNLKNTSLTGVTGTNTNFQNSLQYSNTNLGGAIITNGQFQNINVGRDILIAQEGPQLSGMTVKDCNFSNSNLSGATFSTNDVTGSTLINVNFTNAILDASKFTGAIMTYARFQNCTALVTDFTRASLVQADFTKVVMIGAIFNSASLINAKLSDAAQYGSIDLTSANLTGAVLTSMDFQKDTGVILSIETNFTKAQMIKVNLNGQKLDKINFMQASMQNTILTSSSFNGTIFVGTDLTSATFTNNSSFLEANFSNAILTGVDLTGAQMGAATKVALLQHQDYQQLDQQKMSDGLLNILKQHTSSRKDLQPNIEIRVKGESWVIELDQDYYYIYKNEEGLVTFKTMATQSAAVMTNVFMENVILTNANLFGVDMVGANWSGSGESKNAILEQVNLSNANLSLLQLKQAKMFGANLSFAKLINTILSKTLLSPTNQAKAASLAFASLQGATFTQASLKGADLTNAAVSLEISNSGSLWGVSAFTILSTELPTLILALNELDLTNDIKKEFETNGYPLPNDSKIGLVTFLGSIWIIRPSKAVKNYKQFVIILEDSYKLHVYGEVTPSSINSQKVELPYQSFIAVPIFQIFSDQINNIITSFDQADISESIKTTFNDSGYPLIDNAGITVISEGLRWTINNRNPNQNVIQSGYAQFDIIVHKIAGTVIYLQVFGGNPVLVTKTAKGNQLTTTGVFFSATSTFDANIMDDSTTCPSGLKFSLLGKGIGYEQLMTAGLPPHPPNHIPSSGS